MLQLIPVAPVCDSGRATTVEGEELETGSGSGKAYVLSFADALGGRGQLLALFDDLPAFLDWDEIPLLTSWAYYPSAARC